MNKIEDELPTPRSYLLDAAVAGLLISICMLLAVLARNAYHSGMAKYNHERAEMGIGIQLEMPTK